MSSILDLLGLSTRVDSQGQLDAAKNHSYGDAAEAEARRRGFPSAEAMLNWQRQQNVQGSNFGHKSVGRDVVKQVTGHPMHPANILDYILQAFKGANGGH